MITSGRNQVRTAPDREEPIHFRRETPSQASPERYRTDRVGDRCVSPFHHGLCRTPPQSGECPYHPFSSDSKLPSHSIGLGEFSVAANRGVAPASLMAGAWAFACCEVVAKPPQDRMHRLDAARGS